MMDYNSMTTPMVMNLKKLAEIASYSYLVEHMMYRYIIGSLVYLVNTKLAIFFNVSYLSQFMVELRWIHWVEKKHVLRYLRSTVGYGLKYVSGGEVMLHGYTNSNWTGSAMDKKSTFRCCLSLG